MGLKEEYYFWSFIHQLITKYGYRLITASDNQQEVWLENQGASKEPLIRLKLADLDWANSIKKDLHMVFHNAEKIRRHIGKRKMDVRSIYISPFAPVDDYSEWVGEQQESNYPKVNVNSMIFKTSDISHSKESFEKFINIGMNIPEKETEELDEGEITYLRQGALTATYQQSKEEQSIFTHGRPIFTYLLMAIQVLVFIWLELRGGSTNTATLIDSGAKVNILIVEGEWWRLFTPIFLHIGFSHLALNTLSLYFVGIIVERIFGSARFLIIYFFAGFLGSVASFIFIPNLSAGASGAIFGLIGALLFFGIVHPKLFFRTMGWNILLILILNIGLTFSMPSIDSAGHMGGLLGGFLAAAIVRLPGNPKLRWQIPAFILTLLLSVTTLQYGYQNGYTDDNYEMTISLAQEYINEGKYDKGQLLLKGYLNKENKPEAHFLQGVAQTHKKEYEDAEHHFLLAIKQKETFPQAYYNLGLIYIQNGEMTKADDYLSKAVEQDPSNETYRSVLKRFRSGTL